MLEALVLLSSQKQMGSLQAATRKRQAGGDGGATANGGSPNQGELARGGGKRVVRARSTPSPSKPAQPSAKCEDRRIKTDLHDINAPAAVLPRQ